MRLHHAEKTAGTLPIDTPEREHAKAVIVTEIDRLHWRIWNGKAKDARIRLSTLLGLRYTVNHVSKRECPVTCTNERF